MSKFKTNEDYFAYSKTLSVIPTEDVILLLEQSKIRIPYYVHRFLLRETIYPKVFQNKLYATYSDELKYRLRGFNDYSIYLLEKLIDDYHLDFDAAKYKENFFNFLFLNRDQFQLKNHFFDELDKLKFKYTVDFEKINYKEFIRLFETILFEPTGYLDGVSLKILKDVLVHSCTLGDLRGLGEKYGVKVPRRINKSKLVEILAARFRLSPEESTLLNDKSVLELEIYAKEKGFNISIDLKKSDMVEYMIYDLKLYHKEVAKDPYSYQIPLVSDLDSVKIDTISFEANDQDIPVVETEEDVQPIPEAAKEEDDLFQQPSLPIQKEEVIETPPVEEPTVLKKEPIKEEEQPIQEEPKEVEKPTPKKSKKQEEPAFAKAEPAMTTPAPVVQAVAPEEITSQEKELLDEKIQQIIKRYKKRRRNRRIGLVALFVILLAILGFAMYIYLYYVNTGNFPAWFPSFLLG